MSNKYLEIIGVFGVFLKIFIITTGQILGKMSNTNKNPTDQAGLDFFVKYLLCKDSLFIVTCKMQVSSSRSFDICNYQDFII